VKPQTTEHTIGQQPPKCGVTTGKSYGPRFSNFRAFKLDVQNDKYNSIKDGINKCNGVFIHGLRPFKYQLEHIIPKT
jgi:hypothetical protein